MGNKFTGAKSFNGDLLFGYDQMRETHQPRTMYDPNNGTMDLYWDANGNLAQVIGCVQNSGRLHEWDVKRNSRTEKSPVDSSRSKCGARVCQSKHRTQLDRLRFVLSDKYPQISPYAYCMWNPVKYVDPDGNDIYTFDEDGSFLYKKVQEGIHYGVVLKNGEDA